MRCSGMATEDTHACCWARCGGVWRRWGCLQVLEIMLEAYSGCVIIVSHDRAFMENVVDSMLVLDGTGAVQRFTGRYSAYLRQVEKAAAAASEAAAAAADEARRASAAEKAASRNGASAAAAEEVRPVLSVVAYS